METKEVLQSMFTENTGRHFLDSGGAYGRHWEMNQGKDMSEMPEAWHSYGPTLSTFHYLLGRLGYAAAMDRLFNIWSVDSDESWLSDMEEFAEKMHDQRWTDTRTFNSYNDETFLDQVIQWVEFDHDGQHYILLQVHGGCDVRGGYTKPVAFTVDSEYWYYQCCDAGYYCNSGKWIPTDEIELAEVEVMGSLLEIPAYKWKECDFRFEVYNNELVGKDGFSVDTKDLGLQEELYDKEVRCPDCGDPLKVDAPYPSY